MGRRRVLHRRVKRKARRGRSIFYRKPYYRKYAEIVTFKSPEKARDAVRRLVFEAKTADTRAKKVRVWRVLNLASVRARASARRKNLKPSTKRRLLRIAVIYRTGANMVKRMY